MMPIIQQYLMTPKVKKILQTKPDEDGFSLIELVVVVAVLAILAAIGIPAFNGVIERAEVAVAMAHLVNATKECQIKIASYESNPTYTLPQNTSNFQYPDSGNDGECLSPSTGNILTAAKARSGQAVSDYNLNINVVTGEKSVERTPPSFVVWE